MKKMDRNMEADRTDKSLALINGKMDAPSHIE